MSEGYNAPFVGIIKSGECHVLRQVEILQTLPNGQKVVRIYQIKMPFLIVVLETLSPILTSIFECILIKVVLWKHL